MKESVQDLKERPQARLSASPMELERAFQDKVNPGLGPINKFSENFIDRTKFWFEPNIWPWDASRRRGPPQWS